MALVKLDVDGVLIDIHKPWLAVYNALSGDNLKRSDLTRWEIHEFVKPGWEQKIYECRLPELYDRAQPLPGAQFLVKMLQELGHRLVVVTHDFQSHLPAKVSALQRLFPTLTDIVFAKEKNTVVRGGILIDDCQYTAPDVLFSQPWNETADPMTYGIRARNHFHALDVIRRLAEMKEYADEAPALL
jgi:5'(3')-deoxyribonucleotidase